MNSNSQNRRLACGKDFLLILAIAAAALLFLLPKYAAGSENLHLIIEQDGQIVCDRPLSSFHSPEVIRIGETAVEVTADSHGAAVTSSDCRDQICVRTGKLTRAGETAVCLPNKVVVRLAGKSPGQIDGITG